MSKHVLSIPNHVVNMWKMRQRIYKHIVDFDMEVIKSKEPIAFKDIEYDKFAPYRMGFKWGDRFDCAWFRLTADKPTTEGHLVAIINNGGEGAAYTEDGTVTQGVTIVQGVADGMQSRFGKQIVELTPFEKDGKYTILLDSGNNKFLRNFYFGTPHKNDIAKMKTAGIYLMRDDILELYYDYLTVYEVAIRLDRDDGEYKAAAKRLKKAAAIAAKDDYDYKNVAAAHNELTALLKELKIEKPYSAYMVGHAHLDLAWLWPIRETKRKAVRTLTNAFYNLEKYDGFIMGISQPQMIEWMEKEYPAVFEKFKHYVAEDRIELQGGMWIESDCNLNSGESLVRQFLYGKKYWYEKFGKTVETCWLPDAFGFNGQLPQIMRKSGIPYFYTIKISWNSVNKFPYQSFVWRGIDGSEVLTHMSPEGNYNSSASPLAVAKSIANYRQGKVAPVFLMTYGPGDGGGGPGEFSLEVIKRTRDLPNYHKVKQAKAIDFFHDLEQYRDKLPTFTGELYLEKHRGTYTSQAKTKLYNRRAEIALHDYEAAAVLAAERSDYVLDKNELDDIWREVLLYQFHDVLPGSSIGRVYQESGARYETMIDTLSTRKTEALSGLVQKEKDEITVLNLSSVPQKGYVKVGDFWYEANLPAYSAKAVEKYGGKAFLRCDERVLENDVVRLQFDSKGVIVSFIDKTNEKQLCGEYLNKLNLYQDKEMYYNAWDIDPKYVDRLLDQARLRNVKVYVDGPTIVRRQEFTYLKSIIVQDIILQAHDKMVRFETKVDWKENATMLRADFAPAVYNDEIGCDEQFGYVKRRTTNNNKIEAAQFEICAHKYVNLDLSDSGLAFINDCKYGLRAKDGTVSLNLLRSPTYPDKRCDRGEHYFAYALYPHDGTLENSDVYERAVAFNNPLQVFKNGLKFDSMAYTDNKCVIVDGIKPREDGKNGYVLRTFNNSENEQTTKLTLGLSASDAYYCDLMENVTDEKADLDNLHYTPFEIKTIIVENKKRRKA